MAVWNGVILAESTEYEVRDVISGNGNMPAFCDEILTRILHGNGQFLDGRFFFPPDSVRWELLKGNGKTRYLNPIGISNFYDIELPRGKRTLRNRCAVLRFGDLRKPWNVMKGFCSFWKGVKVRAKAAERNDELSLDVLEEVSEFVASHIMESAEVEKTTVREIDRAQLALSLNKV